MTELSPAAQAVMDGVCDNTEPDCDIQHLIAAAPRAVVLHAQPKARIEDIDYVHQHYVDGWEDALGVVLAITAELEGQ